MPKPLIKNGKFFQSPPKSGKTFKELFIHATTTGVGRPANKDGYPIGPWTPELLADAISQIDANRKGVDLRTVQLWFENNKRGIGPTNIRWLAMVFGCRDPEGTSEWQVELSASQSRLKARRKQKEKAGGLGEQPALDVNQAAEPEKSLTLRSSTRLLHPKRQTLKTYRQSSVLTWQGLRKRCSTVAVH